MTERERLDRNTKPTKALAVRQKQIYDLPDDIVRHIIGKLCWSDRIRLPAVCKSLRSLVHGVQTIDEFPWIMSCNWQKLISGKIYSYCRLADPSAQKCYVIEDAVKGKEKNDFAFSDFFHAIPCASRNGWVLFKNLHQIFFYSPFTNEVIKLPKFDFDFDFDFDSTTHYLDVTFSSNPTSPDCVVFALSYGVEFGSCISTWSPCDKTWTHMDLGYSCGWSVTMTYAGGIFYLVFEDGKLGAYNAVLKDWKLFANMLPMEGDTVYLIESNEDKELLAIMCPFGDRGELWRLWRFDLSQESWVEERRIGNRAIFLGRTSYSVPAVGRSSEFANKIYCLELIHDHTEPRCASLDSPALGSQNGLYDWMPKITGGTSIWIKPPFKYAKTNQGM